MNLPASENYLNSLKFIPIPTCFLPFGSFQVAVSRSSDKYCSARRKLTKCHHPPIFTHKKTLPYSQQALLAPNPIYCYTAGMSLPKKSLLPRNRRLLNLASLKSWVVFHAYYFLLIFIVSVVFNCVRRTLLTTHRNHSQQSQEMEF
jgi:hypothetical protein